jgi:hypothetical protein
LIQKNILIKTKINEKVFMIVSSWRHLYSKTGMTDEISQKRFPPNLDQRSGPFHLFHAGTAADFPKGRMEGLQIPGDFGRDLLRLRSGVQGGANGV